MEELTNKIFAEVGYQAEPSQVPRTMKIDVLHAAFALFPEGLGSLKYVIALDETFALREIVPGCTLSMLSHLRQAAGMTRAGGILVLCDTSSSMELLDPSIVFPQMGNFKQPVFTDFLTWDNKATENFSIRSIR